MRMVFALLLVAAPGCDTLFPQNESPDAPDTTQPIPRPDARVAIGPDGGIVASDCAAPPASASASVIEAYNRMTALRATAGAPCATFVEELDTSAGKHSQYFAANTGNQACVGDVHAEVAGCAMFVAARFDGREVASGYTGEPASETMAFGSPSIGAAQSVQLWVDSVWHRTPVLSPWIRDVGFGDAPNVTTMDFGVGETTPNDTIVLWPADGQTDVPTSFDGTTESPRPPEPPGDWPSGYPITIFLKGTVTSAVLTRDGDSTPVDAQAFGPSDAAAMHLLQDDYMLYSNEPLLPATTYHVHAVTSRGTLDWSFTTH